MRVGAFALYLPTAHPRASSPPTDSPFRMSHRGASKHKHTEGAATRRVNYTTTTGRLYLKCRHFSGARTTSHPTGRNTRRREQRGGTARSFVPSLRRVCRMFRGTGFVTPPLLPSPFLLSWADDNTRANSNPSPQHNDTFPASIFVFNWLF